MSDFPLFSIILPIYNVEKYIDRCMNTILNQEFSDYEIILVDDGSTDSSPEICDRYGEFSKKIKVLHKKNGGLSSARNAGLNIAIGKYIFWLDSDDYLPMGTLKQLGEILYKNDVDILKFNYIKQPDNITVNSILKPGNYNRKQIEEIVIPLALENTREFIMSAWAHIYKREFIQKNNLSFVSERQIGSEDYLFNLHVLLSANSLLAIESALYNYDYREGSLSQKYRENLIEKYRQLYISMQKLLIQYRASDYYLKMVQDFYVWNCYYVLIFNEMRIARNHNRKDRNVNIKQLLHQKELTVALKSISIQGCSLKRKLIYILMRTRCLHGVLCISKVKMVGKN